MFKTRLRQWGFLKKMRDIDWQAVAVLRQQRQKLGRKTSAFKVHGRKIKQADLRKYLKDRGISEEDLLAEAAANDITCQNIPDYICYSAPTVSSDPASPGHSSSQNSSTTDQSPTKGLLGTNISGFNPPAMSESALSDAFYIVNRPQSASSDTSSSQMSFTGLPAPDMRSSGEGTAGISSAVVLPDLIPLQNDATFCDQVQQDLGLLLARGLTPDSLDLSSETTFIEPWTFLNPPDDTGSPAVVCPKCHAQISNHLPFPSNFILEKENFMPHSMFFHDMHLESPISHEADLASVWMACCFGACIFVRRQEFDYAAKSLSRADSAFGEMLRTQNSALLTSLNSTLTILNAHDQSKMEMSVVRSALHVAHEVLGTEDPISVTLEWMTALAGRKLPQCRVTTKHLTAIYNQFHSQYGPNHPHTLAILYNVGFSLLRDKLYEEAESQLRKVYEDSKLTLGPSHMQTITALATLSRALSDQKKFEEAVELRKRAVGLGQRTLGQNHPHTLESMRRLALIYKSQGKDDLMEPIYWAVLQGRIKSLGPKHDYTEGSRDDLIELLKKLNKWDEHGEMERTIKKLFEKADENLSDHEVF
jgi:tetratricopeptide (TPR) repeat protein